MPTEPTNQFGTAVTAGYAIQAQLLLDRCHDLIGERDYHGSAAAARQAINLVPNLPDPYIALAEAMVGMGSHQRAVEAYSEAYRRARPDKQYEILKGRAYNKHRSGDYIGSINDLTEMIVLQPDNAQCYIRRGITRAEVADYQGTIDDFDKAAEITVTDANLHNLPAHSHMHTTFAQLDDDNVHADNTGPTRELAQANQGIQLPRNHLPCLGLV